ncbi:MAG TPA: glutathione S-transferase family protein [Alphaproteobacteria bacterium]|jgi:glutathione S-transferase|nr:glutathione S-transferase family protein [Alphaproteobacteria bacterium]
MITLYHAPRSRSSRFLWLLEELGATYEVKKVEIRRGDGSGTRDPANPHPHGKVPAVVHDGTLIFESAAICTYLADLFPDKGLAPAIGEPARGPYLSLLAYYAGVLEPAFVSQFLQVEVPRGTAGWVAAGEAMDYLRGRLADQPYIAGQRFSAADTLYAGTFALFLGGPMLPETPELAAYVKRCTERPAFARAQEKDG